MSGDAVDEVSFMKIFYETCASFIIIMKLHKFPESVDPEIQLIRFPKLSSKLQD